MRKAEFAASLSNPPFMPLPRKQPELQDFSKKVQDFDYKCFKHFLKKKIVRIQQVFVLFISFYDNPLFSKF